MHLPTTKRKAGLAFALTLAALAGQVQSANFRWLNFAPERHFSDADWSIMTSTADEALNHSEDGVELTWKNPDTGSAGSITPAPAAEHEGQRCRILTITNSARGLTATGTQRLCRQADGEWKIVP